MTTLARALLVCLMAATASAERLRLIVRNSSDMDQASAPVTSGIPWPHGAIGSVSDMRLLDAKDHEVPLQVEVLSLWPDRTPQWTLLDFQATVEARGSTTYVLEYGSTVRRRLIPSESIVVEETDTQFSVTTGAALFRVRKTGFNLLDYVLVRGVDAPIVGPDPEPHGLELTPAEEMAEARDRGEATFIQVPATDRLFLGSHAVSAPRWLAQRGYRLLDDATGKELDVRVVGACLDPAGRQSVLGHGWSDGVFLHLNRVPGRPVRLVYPRAAPRPATYASSLGPAQVRLETRGPLRTVVRATGRFQSPDGATLGDYDARLHFYMGRSQVRLQLTLSNREKLPRSEGLELYPLLLHDLTVSLPVSLRGQRQFTFAGDRQLGATHRGQLAGEDDEAVLVQFPSRSPRLARYVARHGENEMATGGAAAGGVSVRDVTKEGGSTQGLVVAVRHLAAHNPKALRVLGRGRVEIGLFPHEAGPCEEFLAGRSRTLDLLLAFHADAPPDLLGVCSAFDHELAACAAPDAAGAYTGAWYCDSKALPLAPLGAGDYEAFFADDLGRYRTNLVAGGGYGTWNFGAQGTRLCRILEFTIAQATMASVESPTLLGLKDARGRALIVLTGQAANVGRTRPLLVAAGDPDKGVVSFVHSLDPVPERGARAALYDPDGAFLCHCFDPTFSVAREYLRRGGPQLLAAAHASALHLADVGTFHGGEDASQAWVGAGHDPTLGDTAHHVPGLSREASWYAGPWLVFLLTGDRALLGPALENAAFAARHADDPDTSPLAAALAAINLSFATDAAAALRTQDVPSFQAALKTYVEKLLDAQARTSHGLYGESSIAAGFAFEALTAWHRRSNDDRIPPSLLQAGQALIRSDRFWSGHEKVGHLRARDGSPVLPYGTGDGLVDDHARDPETPIIGPPCALLAPYLAALTEASGDPKFIKKARRLERVAASFGCGSYHDFALRYRDGDLFTAAWQRHLAAHPQPTDDAIAFQCRLENAADVAMPDVGDGGCVLYRPFVALPDGSRAYHAQSPGGSRRPGVGLWFPFADGPNVGLSEGAIEFRLCYRKGPGGPQSTWLTSGNPRVHGFAFGLKGNALELFSRYDDRLNLRLLSREVRVQPGQWHHAAFAWRPSGGVDLFFDGRKVGHARPAPLGFGPRLHLAYDPEDPVNDYLLDDLRIWKRVPDAFPALTHKGPPAAVTDLRLDPAEGGKLLLSWTAPSPGGPRAVPRRYDIRLSTERFGPVSWGGAADAGDPLAAIHWAEAERLVPAGKPLEAGQLETLLFGPAPRGRRVYIALKADDGASASALSNPVTNGVNHPPVADPGPPLRHALPGSTLYFDASGSSDPDDDDLTYEWSNGIKAISGTRRYDEPGTHEVTLAVFDGWATTRAKATLVVADTVRINFQPPSGVETPKGFLPDTGAAYDPARGFGWRFLPPGTRTFARKEPADFPIEARTGIALPKAAEWVFDLPNGSYSISLAVGDPAHLAGTRRVFLEGREVLHMELTGQTRPVILTDCPVEVTDGQLNVHVGALPAPDRPAPEGGELNYILIQRAPE